MMTLPIYNFLPLIPPSDQNKSLFQFIQCIRRFVYLGIVPMTELMTPKVCFKHPFVTIGAVIFKFFHSEVLFLINNSIPETGYKVKSIKMVFAMRKHPRPLTHQGESA